MEAAAPLQSNGAGAAPNLIATTTGAIATPFRGLAAAGVCGVITVLSREVARSALWTRLVRGIVVGDLGQFASNASAIIDVALFSDRQRWVGCLAFLTSLVAFGRVVCGETESALRGGGLLFECDVGDVATGAEENGDGERNGNTPQQLC